MRTGLRPMPLKAPANAKALQIEVYDPTIFVDFEFAKQTPVFEGT